MSAAEETLRRARAALRPFLEAAERGQADGFAEADTLAAVAAVLFPRAPAPLDLAVAIVEYDNRVNDAERVPTAEDYNELVALAADELRRREAPARRADDETMHYRCEG